MKLITIITFLIPVAVATHHHKTLLKTILRYRGNFFTKINKEFQNIMNNLFTSLDLPANFLGKPRVQLLLTMHYDMKSIAEKNYDIYEEMKNITEFDRNPTTKKIELFDLIEEILNDNHLNVSDGVKEKPYHMPKHAKFKTKNNITVSEFGDSKEFTKFIEAFINKVDNLGIKDFTKNTPIFPIAEEAENSTEYNLEVWEPPSIIELDFINDTESRRLYRGTRVKILEFPFVASVHLLGVFVCAGTIISKDLVLTAASCLQILHNNRFYRENTKDLYVRIGSDYYVLGGEVIEILEVYFHPSYEPKTLRNNLVMLRLQRWIKFLEKKRKARRILYDKIPASLPANTDGILALGWGARKPKQLLAQFQLLRAAQLDIYQLNECADIYSKSFVTERHFCAGFISKGGGACNKDLGGPGIVGGKLVGVISFGSPVCGAADAPTVFTKVGYYAKWIESIENMQPVVGAKRTTLFPHISKRYPYHDKTLDSVEPIVKHYRARLAKDPEDILEVKSVLKELAMYNTSFLDEFLYGEGEYDFYEMFTPTEKLEPLQHPLVNKSLFLIPDIHTFETTPTNYVTIPFTTSSTVLPIPSGGHTVDVTETAPPPAPTLVPVTTTRVYLTDLFAQTKSSLRVRDEEYVTDDSDDDNIIGTRAPLHSDEDIENPKSYSSYEDYNAIKKIHTHRNHQHRHHKKMYLKQATEPLIDVNDPKYVNTNEVEYDIDNISDGDLEAIEYESERK